MTQTTERIKVEDAAGFREFVRKYLDDEPNPDPKTVAGKVVEQLTDAECRVAAGVTVRYWLSSYASSVDRSARRGSVEGADRVARLADWYSQVLGSREFTGSEWKFLRDCTRDDVEALAALRFAHADATRKEGERWAQLATVMQKRKCKTVADVPEPVLRGVLAP